MIVIIGGKAINPAQVTSVTWDGPVTLQVSFAGGGYIMLDEAKVREALWDAEQPTLEGVVSLLNNGLGEDAYRIGQAISKD